MAKEPESDKLDDDEALDDVDEELEDLDSDADDEVADIGDTVLTKIERDREPVETPTRQQAVANENARRRVEDYLEMKRAAKELHDLDDFDYED